MLMSEDDMSAELMPVGAKPDDVCSVCGRYSPKRVGSLYPHGKIPVCHEFRG